eukprot:jgi/Botrbrau1/23500/Bobra.106_1s0051.1
MEIKPGAEDNLEQPTKAGKAVHPEVPRKVHHVRGNHHTAWGGTVNPLLATVVLIILVWRGSVFVGELSRTIEREALGTMAQLAPLKVCVSGQRQVTGSICRSAYVVCTDHWDPVLDMVSAPNEEQLSLVPTAVHPPTALYVSENWDLTTEAQVQWALQELWTAFAIPEYYGMEDLENYVRRRTDSLWIPFPYVNHTQEDVDALFLAMKRQLGQVDISSTLFVESVPAHDLNAIRRKFSAGSVSLEDVPTLNDLDSRAMVLRLDGSAGVSAAWFKLNQTLRSATNLAERSRAFVQELVAKVGSRNTTGALNGSSPIEFGSLDKCAEKGTQVYVLPSSCYTYTCMAGVDVSYWGDWANFLAVTKQMYPTSFLAIKGNYDDMYAIYTGAIGGLLGAAAVFVATFILVAFEESKPWLKPWLKKLRHVGVSANPPASSDSGFATSHGSSERGRCSACFRAFQQRWCSCCGKSGQGEEHGESSQVVQLKTWD